MRCTVKSLLSFLYLVTPPKTMAPTTRPLQPSNQRPTMRFVAALGTVTADLEGPDVSTVKVTRFLLTSHCRSCGLCWCYKTTNKERTWKSNREYAIAFKRPGLTILRSVLPSQQSVTACSDMLHRYVLLGAEFQYLEEMFFLQKSRKAFEILAPSWYIKHHEHSKCQSLRSTSQVFFVPPFCSTLFFLTS